ncbi:MAG: PrsW family intramembrane metalloprotease [Chloroflexi bacterium]|nr:PrsW family intramembrane metalloprotease [Chloroflexota bacterium]
MQKDAGLHLSSLVQLLLNGLGVLFFLTTASGFAVTGMISLGTGKVMAVDILPFFTLAWTSGLVAVLLLPALVFSLLRLIHRQPPALRLPNGYRLASRLMLFAWPALVLLGQAVSNLPGVALFLLPPIQLLVVGMPLWWFVERGRKDVASAEPERNWKTLSFGLLVSPPAALVAEFVVLGMLMVAIVVWAASQPGMNAEINRLAQRMIDTQIDPEIALSILRPYLQRPTVILAILVVGGGLIPLVEEFFKPLALWAMAPRLTPAAGFVAGTICGAAFALLESMGTLVGPTEDVWAGVVIGRVGTGLLHTVNSGLVGWGLAAAWSQEHYLDLGVVFLLAVALHGTWNVFSILLGISPLFRWMGASDGLVTRLGMIAPAILGVLMVTFYLLLSGSNRRLRSL